VRNRPWFDRNQSAPVPGFAYRLSKLAGVGAMLASHGVNLVLDIKTAVLRYFGPIAMDIDTEAIGCSADQTFTVSGAHGLAILASTINK
jgi:hypothetical protein